MCNFDAQLNARPLRPPCRVHPYGMLTAAALAGVLLSSYASATVLRFDETRNSAAGNPVVATFGGADLQTDYGDRVSAGSMPVPGGTFTYGNSGEGFTPNVTLDAFAANANQINSRVSLWGNGYGDLVNVLFGDQNTGSFTVQLTADAGFEVRLFHFDLAGFGNRDFTINEVRVTDGTGALFSQLDVLVEGDLTGPRHTAFDFASPLAAQVLNIVIDYSNLAGNAQDNIGIDNIRFGQDPAGVDPPPPPPDSVPEPGTALLAAMALLAALARKRRRA